MLKKLLVKPNQRAHTDRGEGWGKCFSEMKKLNVLCTPKIKLLKIGRAAEAGRAGQMAIEHGMGGL